MGWEMGYGLYMAYIWLIIYGLYVGYMWLIYGLYVGYMWVICGLYVGYMSIYGISGLGWDDIPGGFENHWMLDGEQKVLT